MRTTKPTTLIRYLEGTGIRPMSFAYFLKKFLKRKQPKDTGKALLNETLKSQAELIIYHLEN